MKIINDPINIVFQAFKNLYGNVEAEIWYNMEYSVDGNEYGSILFPDDGTTPIIDLNPNLPIVIIAEILSHELAHLIVGDIKDDKDGHNVDWDNAFSQIHKEYHRILG